MNFPNDMLMRNLREEEWERTVEVNCEGALNCVGTVLPGMLRRGRGHIITVSSDAGRKVFPGLAAYSASKFFVEALSQGLRLETAGTGLKVTTIQPGNVATILLALSGDEQALELYGQPSGARVLDPQTLPPRSSTRSPNQSTCPSTRSWWSPGTSPTEPATCGNVTHRIG